MYILKNHIIGIRIYTIDQGGVKLDIEKVMDKNLQVNKVVSVSLLKII